MRKLIPSPLGTFVQLTFFSLLIRLILIIHQVVIFYENFCCLPLLFPTQTYKINITILEK